MNSIYCNSIQSLNELKQFMQNSFNSFPENCQKPTFWIGNPDEMAIAAISLHENSNEVFIEACIPELDSKSLVIQLTQATASIRLNCVNQQSKVKSSLNPRQIQFLIPWEYSVHSASCLASLKNDVLLVRLLKKRVTASCKIQLQIEHFSVIFSCQPPQSIEAKNLVFRNHKNEDFTPCHNVLQNDINH